MKNKKLVIILTSMMVLIGGILYVNQIYNKSKNKHIPKRNNLAIMIKEDGATDYTKSTSKDIPKGDYTLNYEKSYCKNNGVIGDYDSTLGKVSFSFVGTDSCFLYFDYKKSTLYQTIENRYNEDKTYLGLYTGEESDTYQNKVYYYKDDVQNNNVLFADFCWKIVRTTETGGVKLIYNGVQKETNKYSSYQKLDENDYTITNADDSFPLFVYDNTNKIWKSPSSEELGNEFFSEFYVNVKENGNYQLNALINSISEDDIMIIYLNGNTIGKGENCGEEGCLIKNDSVSIDLSLTTDDQLDIFYNKASSSTDGTDYAQFYLQKGVGNPIKTCNNTGTSSQIGTSKFNSSSNSPAYVGYMYNNVYTISSKEIIYTQSVGVGTKFSYATSVTYSNGTYTLGSDYKSYELHQGNVDLFNTTVLLNKYVCFNVNSNTCSSVAYVVGFKNNYYYYYALTNGDTNGTDNSQNLVFGSSFTYANGTYSLSGTTTINTDNWASQSSNIDTHHYTCFSSGTTCSSLYYVYYIDGGTPYYITLTGGKSVDDAINEMLYNSNTKSSTSSTIKNKIDNWYANNMTNYTDMLEDTVFCNDRSMSNKTSNGWYPNGGSTSTTLQYKNYNIPTTSSLKCTNENDKFTVDSSNGNGALTYPVGLLTVPEAKLANYGSSNYLNNGQYVWLGSSADFDIDIADVRDVTSNGFNISTANTLKGVRPVISLKPNTNIKSGDGSFTSPFLVE